ALGSIAGQNEPPEHLRDHIFIADGYSERVHALRRRPFVHLEDRQPMTRRQRILVSILAPGRQAVDPAIEPGYRVPKRNLFAEHYEGDLVIAVHLASIGMEHEGGVVFVLGRVSATRLLLLRNRPHHDGGTVASGHE